MARSDTGNYASSRSSPATSSSEFESERLSTHRFSSTETDFSVFYEVGRIDELPSFPYVNVGVDSDGVLVGRTENGDIGLVICSFLEPLTA
jgi:hypothetical protein